MTICRSAVSAVSIMHMTPFARRKKNTFASKDTAAMADILSGRSDQRRKEMHGSERARAMSLSRQVVYKGENKRFSFSATNDF